MDDFYADATLYDRLFGDADAVIEYYRRAAAQADGPVLELGSGTGSKLIPIAADGHDCTGLELAPAMLAEARRKAQERGVEVRWVRGDMRDFELDERFALIFCTGNSLLHLQATGDLVDCFRAVRRHLIDGGRFVFDVFNPSVRLLAQADGTRRRRDDLTHEDPQRGTVHVDVEERYDAAAQMTRGRWWCSSDDDPDFRAMDLEIRNVFPQELLALFRLGGLRVVERLGGWSGEPFGPDSPLQLVVCEADPR